MEKEQTQTRQRRRLQEVYIVEYAVSEAAKDTVSDKLKRLMLKESARQMSERTS